MCKPLKICSMNVSGFVIDWLCTNISFIYLWYIVHPFICECILFHSIFCNHVDVSNSSFMIAKWSHEDDGADIIEKLEEKNLVGAFYIVIENYKSIIFSLSCYWTWFTGAVRKDRTCKEQVANEYRFQRSFSLCWKWSFLLFVYTWNAVPKVCIWGLAGYVASGWCYQFILGHGVTKGAHICPFGWTWKIIPSNIANNLLFLF